MAENKDLRAEQNERRRVSGEPPTMESMLRDLTEEAEDSRSDAERKKDLGALLDLEKATRLP